MDFKILDASAFYAGLPFRSSSVYYTTTQVYDEIKHIKKNHEALETLLETNRLKIMDPEKEDTTEAVNAAKKTGDLPQLSKQDISIIALCMRLGGEIITDDFAVTNVAKSINLKVSSLMTMGIADAGRWIHYCPGCKTQHSKGRECPFCGTPLKRKLLKG